MSRGATFASFAADLRARARAVPADGSRGRSARTSRRSSSSCRAATARRRCSPPSRSGTCSRPRTRGSTSPPAPGSRRRSPTSTLSASPTSSATTASTPPAASFTSAPTRARAASPGSCASGRARRRRCRASTRRLAVIDELHTATDSGGLRRDARQLEGRGREAADHLDRGTVGRQPARPAARSSPRAPRRQATGRRGRGEGAGPPPARVELPRGDEADRSPPHPGREPGLLAHLGGPAEEARRGAGVELPPLLHEPARGQRRGLVAAGRRLERSAGPTTTIEDGERIFCGLDVGGSRAATALV